MGAGARKKARNSPQKMTRRTDHKGRVTLPSDFISCLVTVERKGDVLQIRKARSGEEGRYSFRDLMAGVNKDNIHASVDFGPAVGGEAL
jgi:hypothetical protein